MTAPTRTGRGAAVARTLRGSAPMIAGTGLLGVAGYAFLTVTARPLSEGDYAATAALYLLVALVGSVLCMALEQETTRVVTARLAQGLGTRDAIRQLNLSAVVAVAVTGLLLAACGPLLIDRVFRGHVGLWWALFASVVGFGLASVPRGVLAARRRLGPYGLVLGADGLLRLLPCLVLAATGVTDPVPYCLAFGFGPVAGLIVAASFARAGEPGPPVEWRSLITGASWLTAAWGASLALSSLPPVFVTAMLPDEPGRAATFSFASVMVRLPLFILYSVQPMVLPVLTHAAASHDAVGLRRGIRQAVVVVGGFGALVLFGAAPVGLWLIHTIFGGSPAPSVAILTLLAAGTVLAMFVQILQPALLAVAAHRIVAVAWVAGVLAFAATFSMPIDAITRATLAALAASAITAAVMAVALSRRLAAPAGGRAPVDPEPRPVAD